MKKTMIGLILAAVMALSLAACGAKKVSGTIPEPGWERVYESGGMKLAVPTEYDKLVNVTVPDEIGEDGVLFTVAEKASVEAAKKQGVTDTGAGELFAICRVSESELNARRCYDMSGQDAFAKDGNGNYYIYCHPTDVRFTRESYESVGDENSEDWKQWSKLNEWANGKVRIAFVAGNSGLTAVSYGNTDLDMFLARAAYASGERYTLGMSGLVPLSPNGVDAAPFVERLTTDVIFEWANDGELPEGEFVSLRFPDADYRFDFFLAPDGENYVRQIWNSEQNTMLYKARYLDGMTRASDIVKEWYDVVAANDVGNAALGYKPDDLVGTWAEKNAHRGVITIARSAEEGKCDVRIEWSGSAFEKGVWEMTAKPAGEGGILSYQNGRYLIRTYSSDTEYTDAVQYENGTGTFTLNSAFEIMWQDDTGRAGDDCVFVNTTVVTPPDAAVADLVGTWEEPGTFGGKNNTLTVREDGSFALAYAAGGTRVGTVDILAEEHPDGSKSDWYAFRESDGSLWACFAVPQEKPFNDIYSGQDGEMHFVRIKAEAGNK